MDKLAELQNFQECFQTFVNAAMELEFALRELDKEDREKLQLEKYSFDFLNELEEINPEPEIIKMIQEETVKKLRRNGYVTL